MIPTHFAATIRPRGKAPAVTLHGPICDRLLIPVASAASRVTAWQGGHRRRSVGDELFRIRAVLSLGADLAEPEFTAEPLTEAEHAARFPDEAETPFVGGYPAALFPPRPATATGA